MSALRQEDVSYYRLAYVGHCPYSQRDRPLRKRVAPLLRVCHPMCPPRPNDQVHRARATNLKSNYQAPVRGLRCNR